MAFAGLPERRFSRNEVRRREAFPPLSLPGRKEIAMNREKSCGAVVFARRSGEILYVIVRKASGAYSFPKGHVEGSETEMQTAARIFARLSGNGRIWSGGKTRHA